MSETYSIINGDFVPASHARIDVGDMAIQRGYGVFDFLRTIGGRILFRRDHLDRLEHSARAMRLPLPLGRATLEDLLDEMMERNKLPDSGIRITVTGGTSPDGYSIGMPMVVITQGPLALTPNPRPVSLVSWCHQRQLPHIKTIDYLMAVWLRQYLAEQRADEVLYHDGRLLSECPRNNVFIVTQDGELATPASNVLAGITRKNVLEIARPLLSTVERAVAIKELRGAREMFITSTSRKIVPVIQVDGQPISDGVTGEVTSLLARELDARIAEESEAGSR